MIIIFTQCFPPNIGGIEDLMFNLAHHLGAKGKEVYVLADGNVADDRVYDFQVKRFSGIKFIRKILKKNYLAKLIKAHKVETIITDSWKSLEYLPKESAKIKILCLAHGAEFPQDTKEKKKLRITNAMHKAQYIIANSTYTKSLVDKYIESTKCTIINPGFSFADSTELKVQEKETPMLLTIARLEPRKGVDQVINILPRLKDKFPEIKYKIAGNGDDLERLKQLVEDHKLTENVEFLGFISEEEKKACYAEASLFVMPTRIVGNSVEGFGIVYVEAAAYGVPSIAGKKGGAADAVLDNKTGFLCDSDDEIYEKILILLSHKDLHQSFSDAAKVHAQKFKWENIAQQYLKLI